MSKLTSVKIIHTVVWIFFNVVIFYMLYAVIANEINKLVWTGVSIVFVEGIVLLIFKGVCPLTIIARRYSDSSKSNFDIYLPEWLAKNNKRIYTAVFFIIICLLFFRTAA